MKQVGRKLKQIMVTLTFKITLVRVTDRIIYWWLVPQDISVVYFIQHYQWKYTILSAEVYNTISGRIQYYQQKYTILSADVYNTISGSIQYYQRTYTILSAEVYNTISIQYYQWKYTILHSFSVHVFCWCYTALVQRQSSICRLPFKETVAPL
jgi:hypothetical protein